MTHPANDVELAGLRHRVCSLLSIVAAATGCFAGAQADHPPLHDLRRRTRTACRSPGRQLEDACGVAVDSDGDIYVADYYHPRSTSSSSPARIPHPDPSADPDDGPAASPSTPPATSTSTTTTKTSSSSPPPNSHPLTPTRYGTGTAIDSGQPTGVAVDPATGDVYVDERTYIAVYERRPAAPSRTISRLAIGLGTLEDGYGVAVSDFPATEGDVYVADAATNTVRVYEPASDPSHPAAEIDGAWHPPGRLPLARRLRPRRRPLRRPPLRRRRSQTRLRNTPPRSSMSSTPPATTAADSRTRSSTPNPPPSPSMPPATLRDLGNSEDGACSTPSARPSARTPPHPLAVNRRRHRRRHGNQLTGWDRLRRRLPAEFNAG